MLVLFFVLWIILNGRVTPEILIIGAVLAFAVSVLGYRLFGIRPEDDLRILRNVPVIILYILNLIVEIVKAAASVIAVALNPRKKPEPEIIEFRSGIRSEIRNVLLANSITLTPGTFTLFHEGDYFVVHCLRKEYAEGIEDSSFIRLLKKLH